MHEEIASRRDGIAGLHRSQGMARLEIFGSAAHGTDFDPAKSDADFLREFEPSREAETFKNLFAFENALASVLDREVDLLSRTCCKTNSCWSAQSSAASPYTRPDSATCLDDAGLSEDQNDRLAVSLPHWSGSRKSGATSSEFPAGKFRRQAAGPYGTDGECRLV